jgi:argininosuccinate lyase
VTEVADMLVRDHGLSFKIGHAIAGTIVRTCRGATPAQIAEVVTRAASELGHEVDVSADELTQALSPEHFVAIRRTHGGPAPDVTAEAIQQSRTLLGADRRRVAEYRAGVSDASALLRRTVDAL